MTNLNVPIEKLEIAHQKEYTHIAGEQVAAKLYPDGDLYLFGSEIACLRIAYKVNRYKHTTVEYSSNLKTWYVAIRSLYQDIKTTK